MILYASGRADIAHYYGEWLDNRVREGYLLTRNPLFPNKLTRYELVPDKVDAIVFCSKDYKPFMPFAANLSKNFRTLFEYTVTAYTKDLEPGIPPLAERIDTLLALSRLVGKERVVWRYTPILLTSSYTVERHLKTFAAIADRVKGHVAACIVGFVELHAKLQSRIPDLVMLDNEKKELLAEGIGLIAQTCGIPVRSCGNRGDYTKYGIAREGCITLSQIGAANGCAFREVPHRGNRRGCDCITMRDVGFYDACPALCKYCYANTSPERVRNTTAMHDPRSPLLIGNVTHNDTVKAGLQDSLLRTGGGQLSIFDL